jgi:protein SCO1/2
MSDSEAERRAGLVAVLVPLAAALAIAALAAFVQAPAWLKPASHFHGRDVTSENWKAMFSLTDPSGHQISLADLKGKAVLLAFGYTHCPDACPTTLARLAEVRRLMDRDASRLQVVFVTIDPKRDTGQFLERYVQAFDPTFVGLRGTDAQTDAAATAFHADYEIADYQGQILVSHTVDTYLIDPGGRVRDVLPHTMSAREIAEDVRTVLTVEASCWPWAP